VKVLQLLWVGDEGAGPAAMLLDRLVDLDHEADNFVQGDNDLLVVGNVVLAQAAALAVLEPLLANLVAATRKFQTASGTAAKPRV